MSLISADTITELRAEVREFIAEERAAERWRPRCDSWMSGHDPEFSKRLGDRGWLGMTMPKQYGGHERTAIERYAVTEELVAAGAPVAAHWITDRQTGPMLMSFGTEEQREKYLPGMNRGELFFSIGMSEPDSGSDLASVRTKAEKVEGGWALSGTKVWTTHAHHGHHMITLCRSEPRDDKNRHAGLSQFIVDLKADDVDVRPIRLMYGEHDFNEVILDNTFVPDENVVGVLGNGWQQVTGELAFERSGPERFLSTLPVLAALVGRMASEGDVSDGDAARLGGCVARLSSLRALSLAIAARLEAGEDPAVDAALVKDVGTRFEREVTALARELSGVEPDPDGGDDALERLLADAILSSPGGTLRGGTNEILRGIVARSLGAR